MQSINTINSICLPEENLTNVNEEGVLFPDWGNTHLESTQFTDYLKILTNSLTINHVSKCVDSHGFKAKNQF